LVWVAFIRVAKLFTGLAPLVDPVFKKKQVLARRAKGFLKVDLLSGKAVSKEGY